MEDLRGLMIPLLPARVSAEGYTTSDRYRDFRAVFFGTVPATAEQRERVLFQILAECEIHQAPGPEDSTHATSRWVGRRDVGLALLQYLTHEPNTNQFVSTTETDPHG